MKQRKSFAWRTAIIAGSLLTQPESCSEENTFFPGLLRSDIPLEGSSVTRQWVKHLIISMIVSISLCLLLASCGEAQETLPPELPVDTPVSVSADLKVSMLPFTSLTEKGTRADVDMSAAEKEIKSAYVVQFNGVSPTSTAVWVSINVSESLRKGEPANGSFTLSPGAKSRVYVIANPTEAPAVGTTLQAFESVPYNNALLSALPSTGLPMFACQDVAAEDAFTTFQLKSPLARLTFNQAGTLTLKGIPSAYSLAPVTAGEAAVRPSGVTYTHTCSMTSGTAYYIPANLSGRVALSDRILRCATFAPAGSTYVSVSTNGTIYNVYLGDGSTSDFNIVSNHAYTVSTTINGTNATDMRVGATPPAITALDAEGTANCYIATSANTWYSFNGTVMGNGKSTPLPTNLASGSVAAVITPSPLSPVFTDVLWETWNTTETPTKGSVVRGVYLAAGKVIFRSGSREGNAVVAVRDSENNIIWSWHIWRTNVTPVTQTLSDLVTTSDNFDATGTTTLSGLQMMDRNLGALSATPQDNLSTGLLYQWGRKDPFPAYAGLTSPNNVAMATQPAGIPVIPGSNAQYTVAQSIQQPTTFFKYGGDWCSARNDNLWGTAMTGTVIINGSTAKYNSNAGSKSIYDSCPVGWRVPPAYTFANANTSNGGTFNVGYSFSILTSGSSWFPASGRRSSDGTLNNVEIYGRYWASTSNASTLSSGGGLALRSNNVFPANISNRADGYTCRCVKE